MQCENSERGKRSEQPIQRGRMRAALVRQIADASGFSSDPVCKTKFRRDAKHFGQLKRPDQQLHIAEIAAAVVVRAAHCNSIGARTEYAGNSRGASLRAWAQRWKKNGRGGMRGRQRSAPAEDFAID